MLRTEQKVRPYSPVLSAEWIVVPSRITSGRQSTEEPARGAPSRSNCQLHIDQPQSFAHNSYCDGNNYSNDCRRVAVDWLQPQHNNAIFSHIEPCANCRRYDNHGRVDRCGVEIGQT